MGESLCGYNPDRGEGKTLMDARFILLVEYQSIKDGEDLLAVTVDFLK